MIRFVMGLMGLLIAIIAMTLWIITAIGWTTEEYYVAVLFLGLLPTFAFAAIYASRIGLNADQHSSDEEKSRFILRLRQVGQKLPYHRAVAIASLFIVFISPVLVSARSTEGALMFYSVAMFFGYISFIILTKLPAAGASLISQWSIEDGGDGNHALDLDKYIRNKECAGAIKSLMISGLDYLRVLSVGLFSILFVGFGIVLGWNHATSTSRIIGCWILAAAMLGVLRLLWIYRPHTTLVDETDIVFGPDWSASILDRKFMFVDIKKKGKHQRLRYVTCSAKSL